MGDRTRERQALQIDVLLAYQSSDPLAFLMAAEAYATAFPGTDDRRFFRDCLVTGLELLGEDAACVLSTEIALRFSERLTVTRDRLLAEADERGEL